MQLMAKRRTTARGWRHPDGATIAHIDTKDGEVVALGNLRVLITKTDGAWIAQGLEIDYAAYGDTIPEAKERFEDGLAQTIEAHLRVHRNLEHLLEIAPPEVWKEFISSPLHRFAHSQVSIHTVLQCIRGHQWTNQGDVGALRYFDIPVGQFSDRKS